MSERDGGEIINSITTKEGQVAMDFTGKSGKVITNSKEIQKLANTRNKVKINQRSASQNFIHCDTTVDGKRFFVTHYFTSEPWYHGRITREQSLKLLLAAGVHDGLFLVRESTTVARVFVLTFCMNKRVYHCQLIQDICDGTQTFFSLGKGPAFKTLKELIHFYQKKPLNGVSLALRMPCPKTEYSGYIES
ncbi:unnamed protein product [Porites evermanni]|uniref:SH2 domain-containing protein n=1 Tax=Porites evermanni TaxID=104178 RepID=A0ABN8PSQ0_9CNID|nr:unnamed protein product [Porites evermanni]